MCGIYLSSECWSFEETLEDKLERMKLDKFKKDYPMFFNIEYIIEVVKSEIKVYNNDIMRGLLY